jgi:plastocyanin
MKHLFLAALLCPAIAFSADLEYDLVIRNHQFSPAALKVPAGKKIKLIVTNQDNTPEEFESHALNREKIIAGNSKSAIYIGPLSAGRYPFVGEFHETSAQGVIVAE